MHATPPTGFRAPKMSKRVFWFFLNQCCYFFFCSTNVRLGPLNVLLYVKSASPLLSSFLGSKVPLGIYAFVHILTVPSRISELDIDFVVDQSDLLL
ncbi:hypothetical protein XELAEV_18010577mg [Xenopus laevis]|uniref:Uncharacterized protein n=1 Tax=Xenopus laevis TaxID=8355 RepID=A0A974DWN0_XENLA|nr:hypothetical protein XELAEV_18010577mg [Xenopus laevis]